MSSALRSAPGGHEGAALSLVGSWAKMLAPSSASSLVVALSAWTTPAGRDREVTSVLVLAAGPRGQSLLQLFV